MDANNLPPGFFLSADNSDPPQLWIWRGVPNDASAEPWHRVAAPVVVSVRFGPLRLSGCTVRAMDGTALSTTDVWDVLLELQAKGER